DHEGEPISCCRICKRSATDRVPQRPETSTLPFVRAGSSRWGLTVDVSDAIDACPRARACERRHRTDGGDVRDRQDATRNPTRDRWRSGAMREQLLGFVWAMSGVLNGGALLA